MTVPILLFAAGLGTRMKPLTDTRPKPLISVAGRPLIDHALAFTDTENIGRRVVNVHYKPDMIRGHLGGSDIYISDETDMLCETGGGLKKALPLLDANPVLTMNTDAVWHGTNPINQLLNAWTDDMEALLLMIPKAQVFGHHGQGDFVLQSDRQLRRGPGDIYSGVQMIRTDGLNQIADIAFSMNVLWDQIAARGGLYGTTYTGCWCDVGRPESIAIAENMLSDAANV